jgi:hypothetical protein
MFCRTALVPRSGRLIEGKPSPGIVALSPGATVFLLLGEIVGAELGSRATVALSYLVSYEHMGIVTCNCEGACECDAQRIDAHRPSNNATRSDSIFESHNVPVQTRPQTSARECVVRCTVSAETSSGGHKFKLRQVSVLPLA